MTDSWIPPKLPPGMANRYSKPRDLNTSTIKSEPGRGSAVTSAVRAGAGPPGSCAAAGTGLAAMAGLTASAAAPLTAPVRKLRRLTDLFDLLISPPQSSGSNLTIDAAWLLPTQNVTDVADL